MTRLRNTAILGYRYTRVTAKSYSTTKENRLFCRKIFCGICGRALERAPSGSSNIYYCTNHRHTGNTRCIERSIHEKEIIETLLILIKQQAQLADKAKILRINTTKSISTQIENLLGEVKNLKRLIEKSNATKLSLWEKRHTGDLSQETFNNKNEKLTNQVADYNRVIAELETKIRNLEIESETENIFVERYSKQINIQELTKEVVNEFIKSIHVYEPDRIEVKLNYANVYGQTGS